MSVCTTSSIRPAIIIHENDDNFDDDKDDDVGDDAGSFFDEYLNRIGLIGKLLLGKVWPGLALTRGAKIKMISYEMMIDFVWKCRQ